jgi:release factor glutamine methyltransferase
MIASSDALAQGTARLVASGIDSAKLDARVLLAHVLGKPAGELIGRFEVPQSAAVEFEALIELRAKREPVAYLIGHKEFWSLDFEVGPGVLVPRPETETLVEQAMREFPDRTAPIAAIDFGTGTGCIPLAFLSEFPNARATGVEASPIAIAYARRNKATLAAGARFDLIESDWTHTPAGRFDVVFANPPYLAQCELADAAAELRAEPEAALVSGSDGLEAYRVLIPLICTLTAPSGRVFLEIGLDQAGPVSAILSAAGLETIRIAPDLSGTPRCMVARPQKSVGNDRPSL